MDLLFCCFDWTQHLQAGEFKSCCMMSVLGKIETTGAVSKPITAIVQNY